MSISGWFCLFCKRN